MNETANNHQAPSAAGTLSDRVRSLRLSDSPEPEARGLSWLPWVICALLVCASSVLALEAFSPIDDDLLKKLAEERGLNVGSGTPKESGLAGLGMSSASSTGPKLEISLESKGYIVPISLIQVSPKISGTVMKLNIEEGKYVDKGFVLAVLEDVEYKSDYLHNVHSVKSAQSRIDELQTYREDEVKQAKADLDDAVAQFDQMQLKYDRTKALKNRNAVADEEFESAESSFRSMKARVQRLELTLKLLGDKGPRDAKIASIDGERRQALADLTKAKWRFNNTRIEAPIAGIILSKKTEEGNIVNPSAFSNGLSASLCEMANLFELEVDLSIAERDLAKLFRHQECRVRAEAFPERIYPGYISRIMPTGDRSKGAVPVRVKVQFPPVDAKGQPFPSEKQGEYLRPEMGAIVTFLNRKVEPPVTAATK